MHTMKAIRVNETGGPEVLCYEDVPRPEPEANQALVKIDYAGVNFIDIYFRNGLYPSETPFTNGQEGGGVVDSVGSGVSDLKPGDRVAWTSVLGSYAEYAAIPADRLVKLAENVDTRTAAALMLQGLTAHYLTHSTYPLEPGCVCLVHAAAGGVGLLLVQLAKRRGAEIIATCSTPEKAQRVRAAGADHVILYNDQDFLEETNKITGGKGVDVAYDAVGKVTWEASLKSVKPRGLLVLYGNASGPTPPVAPLTLTAQGSIFMTRPSLVHHIATREELEMRAGDILGWAADGSLDVHIGGEYPLEAAGEAQIDLASRKTSGKLLLKP